MKSLTDLVKFIAGVSEEKQAKTSKKTKSKASNKTFTTKRKTTKSTSNTKTKKGISDRAAKHLSDSIENSGIDLKKELLEELIAKGKKNNAISYEEVIDFSDKNDLSEKETNQLLGIFEKENIELVMQEELDTGNNADSDLTEKEDEFSRAQNIKAKISTSLDFEEEDEIANRHDHFSANDDRQRSRRPGEQVRVEARRKASNTETPAREKSFSGDFRFHRRNYIVKQSFRQMRVLGPHRRVVMPKKWQCLMLHPSEPLNAKYHGIYPF